MIKMSILGNIPTATILIGLFIIGIVNGIGSAIGQYFANKYFIPKMENKFNNIEERLNKLEYNKTPIKRHKT